MTNSTISPENKFIVSFDGAEHVKDSFTTADSKQPIEITVKYSQETLKSLSRDSNLITLNDIDLDKQLNVVIKNADLIKRLKTQENTQTHEDYSSNTLCANLFC